MHRNLFPFDHTHCGRRGRGAVAVQVQCQGLHPWWGGLLPSKLEFP